MNILKAFGLKKAHDDESLPDLEDFERIRGRGRALKHGQGRPGLSAEGEMPQNPNRAAGGMNYAGSFRPQGPTLADKREGRGTPKRFSADPSYSTSSEIAGRHGRLNRMWSDEPEDTERGVSDRYRKPKSAMQSMSKEEAGEGVPIRGRATEKKYWGEKPRLSAEQERLGTGPTGQSMREKIDEDSYRSGMSRAAEARRPKPKGSRQADLRRGRLAAAIKMLGL